MLDLGFTPNDFKDEVLGKGVDRRSFLKICTLAAAAVGLPASAGKLMAEQAAKGLKPSVIWLSYQECTGCSETLLRTSHPQLDELILDLISLDYHEALMAPSGHLAEEARMQAMDAADGKFVLVVEGAIPTADGGIYCKVGGRTALDTIKEAADRAGAIIAIGSCASWGGIPSSPPNPTGAKGAPQVLEGKTVVTIPGCPPNPYNFLGTVLQYATFGTLPALDEKGRPMYAYGRTIHEHCPRRAHFDAGELRPAVRRRGTSPGLVPLQDGLQGPPDPRPVLGRALQRGRRRLADRRRPPLLRLHRGDSSPSRCRCTTRCRSIGRRRPTPTLRSTPSRARRAPGPPASPARWSAGSSARA